MSKDGNNHTHTNKRKEKQGILDNNNITINKIAPAIMRREKIFVHIFILNTINILIRGKNYYKM
jgi:hypothetical protein